MPNKLVTQMSVTFEDSFAGDRGQGVPKVFLMERGRRSLADDANPKGLNYICATTTQ